MISHPSTWLDAHTSSAIAQHAGEAELLRDLHPQQLATIHANRWMKMYVPCEYGGLGLALPDILRIEEGLSWCDGSTAWVVTLCSGAGWFVGFVDPMTAATFFSDENLCVAGSGAVSGTAEITGAGYVLNGHWKYASGALHATALTMNCLIRENGRPVYAADGSPKVAAFILKPEEVLLHKFWNSMGMIATGSHSFEVQNLAVPKQRCFTIEPKFAVRNEPIYRYPFLQLAETTLAANLSGMAVRFVDLAEQLFSEAPAASTRHATARRETDEVSATLNAARTRFYEAADASWQALAADQCVPDQLLLDVSEASRALVHHARSGVNHLYPLCGIKAASLEQEINRVWRNLHTAGQHALFRNA